MYVRTKTFKNKNGSTRTYLQIVESQRVNGKPTQRVVANLGRLEVLQGDGVIDNLIAGLARYSSSQWVQGRDREAEVSWEKIWAMAWLFQALWGEKEFPVILEPNPGPNPELHNLEEAVFALVSKWLDNNHSRQSGVERWAEGDQR